MNSFDFLQINVENFTATVSLNRPPVNALNGQMLLDLNKIDVSYEDFQVIWDVSLNVQKGEMVTLLGPNGSGKSTILNTISNLVSHKKGSIYFDNELISNKPTYTRTKMGISHVLERRRVFPYLTVLQNLSLGAWHQKAKESRRIK